MQLQMEGMGQKLTGRLMITGVNGWPVDVILTQRLMQPERAVFGCNRRNNIRLLPIKSLIYIQNRRPTCLTICVT